MPGVLVHEWISRIGGSEKVFDAMVEAFPDADLLTLWNDDAEDRYPGRPVRESWLARTPFRRSKALALPFMPSAWRNRVGGYDWALVSSHAFAHHVTFRGSSADFRKYVYVHTPARYLWAPELDARGQGVLPRLIGPSLKRLDRRRAQETTEFAANSEYVRARIQRAWGRDARVIYPPVEVDRITSVPDWGERLTEPEHALLDGLPRPFVLGASRFIPYKRLDLVIAAGEAAGMPVVLAGAGPEGPRLRAQAASATVPVSFAHDPSDALLLMAAWLFALAVGRTRDRRVIGMGPQEYVRVFAATWRLFATVAVAAYMFRMEIGRGYLAVAAPLGLGLLLLGRVAWRQWLHRARDRGECQSGILVIGHRAKAANLIDQLHANPRAGYRVIGVCVPSGESDDGGTIQGVPVLGTMDDAAEVAKRIGADAVAVSGADTITADAVRRLGWDLEGQGIDLALTLTLTDVAGPRVLMRPVNGLPLMYVDEPHFSGTKYVVKAVFDWLGAALFTVLVSPLLLVIAIAIKATSRGPVFYTQERVGRNGRGFRMIKFRSMVADADAHLSELEVQDEGNGVLFKIRQDPRVTPVGRLLRRLSLDELPQLFNVLNGSMTLVGPRPPLPREVEKYAQHVERRLLVKPGITGLWQVSGRSDLSWEESVRLDLSYVENWTLFGDLLILVRTARVMVAGEGAY